jgi:hypothetical protein
MSDNMEKQVKKIVKMLDNYHSTKQIRILQAVEILLGIENRER